MSEIIRNFNIFRDFPPHLAQNIKSLYLSKDRNNETDFGYCVLTDDKVYGFGERIHQILGYDKSNEKYYLITELCDENIQEFYQGNGFVFARNDNNEIFSWGRNNFGELARGFKSAEYLRPDKIEFFIIDVKNIIQISCGNYHCLSLSSDGKVYGWGYNDRGEVGCGKREDYYISTPVEIDLNVKIKFIHSERDKSFALSFDENIYYWGRFESEADWEREREKKREREEEWKRGRGEDRRREREEEYMRERIQDIYHPVILNNFIKIKSILNTINMEWNGLLYVISNEGIIYKLRKVIDQVDLEIFCEELKGKTIIDLCVDNTAVIYQTENCVYVCDNPKDEKTSYKTLFEYFLFEVKKVYKTIHIKGNQLFVLDFKSDENSENLIEESKMIYSNEKTFKQPLSLNKLRNSKDLPQILESNVKYFYQSGSDSTYFEFFVMNDHKVYCFGYNKYGNLGLGHSNRIYEYTEITQLNDKNIEEFYQGDYCMFARNDENEIISWGQNFFGQLARDCRSKWEEYLKPEKISFFDGKSIIYISCGYYHCLALSSDGLIYGWGDNRYMSVGCGKLESDYISTPIKIELNEKIKFIYCQGYRSFAVSFNENAYYWGTLNEDIIPTLNPLRNVLKVFYNYTSEVLIILDKNGKLFEFFPSNEEIIEIKSDVEFNDLYYQDRYYLLQSKDTVYELKNRKLIKTDYTNFFDFYYQNLSYYKKTIEISKDGYLMEKHIQLDNKEMILTLIDQLIFERKYENNFVEIIKKGKGGSGTVYEVEKKTNKLHYAIKMIEIQDELDLREIKTMSELNTDFVVQSIDSWIEVQIIFRKIRRYLFIQMELCSQSLRHFIGSMNQISVQKFQVFNYFISCELFKELIECVNYLHSLNPPIIHRDLKPENILISEGINGRFLKLCDFGLAKFHDKSDHSRNVGSFNYIAPEVRGSRKYNTKSDIYSLAVIATEIFQIEKNLTEIRDGIDLTKYSDLYSEPEVKTKYNPLLKTLTKCLLNEYNSRPDSKQLLDSINEWNVDSNTLISCETLTEFRLFLVGNKILNNYFEKKLTKTALHISIPLVHKKLTNKEV